jgi:hypothetical protein
MCTEHASTSTRFIPTALSQAHELSILCGCDIVVLIVAEHDSERAVFQYSSKPVADILDTYAAHRGPVDIALGSMVCFIGCPSGLLLLLLLLLFLAVVVVVKVVVMMMLCLISFVFLCSSVLIVVFAVEIQSPLCICSACHRVLQPTANRRSRWVILDCSHPIVPSWQRPCRREKQ